MQIWPAIDVRGGKCVRLRQGDYSQETVYDEDPAQAAARWAQQGAEQLHLVDLDGARDGRSVNREAVRSILQQVSIPCELGGGIRDEAAIETWLQDGLQRLVVGTQAIKHPDWFRSMCRKYPDRLALGIDARDGRVAVEGWLETSDMAATALAQQFDDEPIAAIIYTDIARDGMLDGPNLEGMAEMKQAVTTPVIASGGVTRAEDVQQLAELDIDGCIIGRSLYEGTLTLREALEAATAKPSSG